MKATDAIRQILANSSGWSQNRLGAELGYSKQVMHDRMTVQDAKAGFLSDAVALMGYKLVVVPPGTKLPNGSIEITSDKEQK